MTTTATQHDLLCERIQLDNGIEKLIVRHVSRQGADAWLYHMEQIVSAALETRTQTVRVLSDSRIGVLPLGYLVGGIRKLTHEYPHPPKIRFVGVNLPSAFTGLADTLTRVLPISNLRVRHMSIQQEAEAIEWLLAND